MYSVQCTYIAHFYNKINYLAHAENLLRLHKINLWCNVCTIKCCAKKQKQNIFTLKTVIELLF